MGGAENDTVIWSDLKKFCAEKQTICKSLRDADDKAVAPTNRWNMLLMLGSAVGASIGFFLYLQANAIRDYDTSARERYVTIATHDRDVQRIETRIIQMETRILDAVKGGGR